MRIERITIRGMLRFAAATTLSLEDAGPGLVAVVGANGEGKTSALEAAIACLYRVFPSRGDKELVDYATGPDSFIETTFALDGQGLYRARLNIDGVHRKADAVLSRINPDGSVQVLTDGKVTTYDTAIAQLLPPLPALLASVFSAQNRAGSFITLDKKSRKELFSSLLGLGVYDTMADRARSAAGLTLQGIEKLVARREVLVVDAGDAVVEALQADANRLQADGGRVELRRAELAAALAETEAALSSLQADAAAHSAATTQLDRTWLDINSAQRDRALLEATRKGLVRDTENERQSCITVYEAAIASLDIHLASTRDRDEQLGLVDRQLTKDLADLDARIEKNRAVSQRADEIRAAVKTVELMDAKIAAGRNRERELTEQIDQRTGVHQQLAKSLATLNAKVRDLERARRNAALLGVVPCAGAEAYAGCQFLTAATAAKDEIPELEEAADSASTVQEESDQIEREVLELRSKRTELQRAIRDREADRATAMTVAAYLDPLNTAEERIKAHEARKTELTADADRRRAELEQQHQARLADLRTRKTEREAQHARDLHAITARSTMRRQELDTKDDALVTRLEALETDRQAYQAEIDRTAKASEDAAQLTAQLRLRRQEWDASTADLARVKAQHEELQRRRTAFESRRRELETLDGQLAGHRADLVEWQLLAKALGRDGLQTLEIDAAGPTVSAFCNDLLQTCFGSRFSVELVTQEVKNTKSRDGNAFKEVFELRVFDSARGGDARDLTDLSGGEQVLVDEALKSAIALLVNQRNAHPMRTCWRDETTGALDGENAARYVDMLRRVQQLGGFHHVLFVSHNPDAARQADLQVRVAGGRIDVVLPPFQEAA